MIGLRAAKKPVYQSNARFAARAPSRRATICAIRNTATDCMSRSSTPNRRQYPNRLEVKRRGSRKIGKLKGGYSIGMSRYGILPAIAAEAYLKYNVTSYIKYASAAMAGRIPY